MINTKYYSRHRLIIICSICIWAISLISASENSSESLDLSTESSVTAYGPKIDLLENSSLEKDSEANSDEKRRKTALGQWASKHRAELIFSTVAVGTGITAIILNSKVKELKAEEKSLFKNYENAPAGSDFDVLWEDYTDAHDETEQMKRVRNGFSLATGGITVAVIMSFYIGRP